MFFPSPISLPGASATEKEIFRCLIPHHLISSLAAAIFRNHDSLSLFLSLIMSFSFSSESHKGKLDHPSLLLCRPQCESIKQEREERLSFSLSFLEQGSYLSLFCLPNFTCAIHLPRSFFSRDPSTVVRASFRRWASISCSTNPKSMRRGLVQSGIRWELKKSCTLPPSTIACGLP